jgi:pyruvate formate lyase activating enzyme
MDIKNSPEKYAITAGVETLDLSRIEESISALMNSNIDYEFRTTVVRELHDAAVLEGIGTWLGDVPRYFLQNFKDSGDLLTQGCTGCSPAEMKALLATVKRWIPSAELRGVD